MEVLVESNLNNMRLRYSTIQTSLMIVCAGLMIACGNSDTTNNSPIASPNANVGVVTPTPTPPSYSSSNNSPATASTNSSPILPDARLTPGDALDVTRDDICTPGYSKKVRNVPQSIKEEAYREYGIASREPGEYEVDHLISLELGGSNSIKNLWPESFRTEPWNAKVKDKLENTLHEMICNGQIDIKTAQREIAGNWIEAYKKYVAAEPSGSTHSRNTGKSSNRSSSTSNSNLSESRTETTTGAVVGNKNSHIYHRPDCPDYDKISQSNRVEFKSAEEAEANGYRLAGNCTH